MGANLSTCGCGKSQNQYVLDNESTRKISNQNNRRKAPQVKMSSNDRDVYDSQDSDRSEFKRKEQINAIIDRIFTREDINKVYNIGKEVGQGKYGTIFIATKKFFGDQRFAIKQISIMSMNTHDFDTLQREINILRTLDHPNVLKFYEIYVDREHFYFVTEYCEGGNLGEMIDYKKQIKEQNASRICQQILRAIRYLHDKGIVHRDIKPDNIMFYGKSIKSTVKLIDFGLSKYFMPQSAAFNNTLLTPANGTEICFDTPRAQQSQINKILASQAGTPYYIAPEVLGGSYNQSCDMWSIGVITFAMLAGQLPFIAENQTKLFNLIKTCDFEYDGPVWQNISKDAQKFIDKLIHPNTTTRMTAIKALEHAWIVKHEENIQKQNQRTDLSSYIFKRLQKFKKPTIFQQEMLYLVVDLKLIDDKEMNQLSEFFANVDTDSSGTIDFEELNNAFSKFSESDSTVSEIMESIDFDRNGEISYSEFLSSIIDHHRVLNDANLYKIFQYLDYKKTDKLSYETFRQAFNRTGKLASKRFIEMMDEVGLKAEPGFERRLSLNKKEIAESRKKSYKSQTKVNERNFKLQLIKHGQIKQQEDLSLQIENEIVDQSPTRIQLNLSLDDQQQEYSIEELTELNNFIPAQFNRMQKLDISDESISETGVDGLVFDQFCNFMRAGEYYEQDPDFDDNNFLTIDQNQQQNFTKSNQSTRSNSQSSKLAIKV